MFVSMKSNAVKRLNEGNLFPAYWMSRISSIGDLKFKIPLDNIAMRSRNASEILNSYLAMWLPKFER